MIDSSNSAACSRAVKKSHSTRAVQQTRGQSVQIWNRTVGGLQKGKAWEKETQGKLEDLRKAIARVKKKKKNPFDYDAGIFSIEWHMGCHTGPMEKKVYM